MGEVLMPCPFCGGEAEMYGESMMAIVTCKQCHVHTKGYTSARRATEAWNTRAAVTDNDFAIAVHDGELWVKVKKPTWSESGGYRCECGAMLRGFKRRCPDCGAWMDYDGVGPKAVLG